MRQARFAAALGIVLAGLAVLQYRWLGDVSAAERERMRANLESRAGDVAHAFDAELTRAFVAFHVDPAGLDTDAAATIADAYAHWQSSAAHPSIVRAIDVVDPSNLTTLRRFDPASRSLKTMPWPPALREWLTRLQHLAPQLPAAPSPLLLADAVDGEIPALVVALPNVQKSTADGKLTVIADPASLARALVVEIDEGAVRDQLLAPLVGRYFGSASDAIVTVVRRDDPAHVVYASEGVRPLDVRSADVAAGLFDLRMDDMNHVYAGGPTGERLGKLAITIVRRANSPDGRRMLFSSAMTPGAWRLLTRYRSDSLDAIVAASRRRNFAIVIVVLLLLGGSVALTMASAERARRLARQQMEFVAAVSHELRTPLAVICSAGENLADGVVADAAQVRRYGSLVKTEGRRLGDMVERVLLFAGIGSGVRTQALADVDVSRVIADAVAGVSADAQDRGVAVTVEPKPALPTVAGDADALRSAVQNIVGNAVKYSTSGGTVDVAADLASRSIVRIRVVDRGIGIDAEDLAHVFKPFYRGRRAVDAQVRGTGIGLSVVRHVIRAHGGDVKVESRVGEGTVVTLVLPVGSAAEAAEGRRPVVRLKEADAES